MDGWKYFIAVFIFIVLLIALTDCEARSTLSEEKHPVYHRLILLQPKLDKKLALSISDEIYKCHKRIGLDKYLITAIYNQESSMNYKAKNCLKGILEKGAMDEIISIIKTNSGILVDEMKLRSDLSNIPLKVCFDLGIGQINVNTALRYPQCADLKRLSTDYKYNIACSCKILEGFKSSLAHKDDLWWTKYNANNPIKREIYRQLVMRYYPRDNSEEDNENITQPKKKVR